MKLSDGEKLIIAMLADIQKTLDTRGDIDPKFVTECLYGGQLWSLKWEYPALFEAVDPSESEVKETVNILDMWSIIEWSSQSLDQSEKERFSAETRRPAELLKFIGFDGNHERHYRIAQHLIRVMKRFEKFKRRELDSHRAKVDEYLSMYGRFEPIRNELGDRSLTCDELIYIISGSA